MKDLNEVLALGDQEIFDIALRETKSPALSPSNGCEYKTESGNHCAVGKIMLSVFGDDNDSLFGFQGEVADLFLSYERRQHEQLGYSDLDRSFEAERSIELMGAIQSAHDTSAGEYWHNGDFRRAFVAAMRDIASDFAIEFKEELV